VKDLLPGQAPYIDPHTHTCDSEFLFIGDNDDLTGLTAHVWLGEEQFVVESPAAVFISRDLPHNVQLVSGSGKFVNIVLHSDYNQSLASNLVESLQSSKRNITGTVHIAPMETQLKAIKSVFKLAKIGVLYNPQEKNSVLALKKLEKAGKEQGFQVVSAALGLKEDKTPDKESIPETVERITALKPQLVYFPSDSFLVSNAKEVVDILNRRGIPVFSATEDPTVKSGALLGLVCHYYNVGMYSAYKAEQILAHGKKPSEIPIDSLNRFSFLFNMNAAKCSIFTRCSIS
jgi:ABC-type uncharacterized transport system substrate-binding protein